MPVSAVVWASQRKRRWLGSGGRGGQRLDIRSCSGSGEGLVRDVRAGSAFAYGLDTVHRSVNVWVRVGECNYGSVAVKNPQEDPSFVDANEFKGARS